MARRNVAKFLKRNAKMFQSNWPEEFPKKIAKKNRDKNAKKFQNNWPDKSAKTCHKKNAIRFLNR